MLAVGATSASADPASFVISGTVTDTGGAPISNVCVYPFEAASGNRTVDAAACSDASGAYTLNLAAGGAYNVVFYDSTGTYVTQWYNDAPFEALATPVTVTDGTPATGIDAVMASTSSSQTAITGTVRRANGTGIANVCVYPFDAITTNRTADPAACTDAAGNYTLPLAAPGSYNIVFYDPSGVYATQWYAGAMFEAQATPVSVAAGMTTTGIDAVLDSATTITGTVTNAAGAGIPNICVYPFDATTTNRTQDAAACTDASGNYTLPLAAAGSYNLAFFDPAGVYATQWYDGVPFEGQATPVSVAAGTTTPSIDATLTM